MQTKRFLFVSFVEAEFEDEVEVGLGQSQPHRGHFVRQKGGTQFWDVVLCLGGHAREETAHSDPEQALTEMLHVNLRYGGGCEAH